MLKLSLTLLLLVAVSAVGCFKPNEIRVFPKFLKDQPEEKIFTIYMTGKELTIRMTPTNSNGKAQLVKTQSLGESTVQSRNCFYEGEIIDVPDSFVHLFACEFMRGLIQVDLQNKFTLDKKDKVNTDANDYFVRKQINEENPHDALIGQFKPTRPVPKHADPEENIKRILSNPKGQEFRAEEILGTQGDVSYSLKLDLLVDTYYYEDVAGKNKRFVVDAMTSLIEIIDRPFATERISVVCGKLTVNDLYDYIILSSEASADYILNEMFFYKTYYLNDALNFDVTYLISGHPPLTLPSGTNFTRSVYLSTICRSNGVGVQLNFLEDNYKEATKIFFLLTRGFGNQDDQPTCRCDAPGGCISDPNLEPSKLKKYGDVGLSSCTYDDFRRYAQANSCVRYRYTFGVLPTNPTCGNWVQEKGEQCDCGRKENCEGLGLSDKCDYKTCRMKAGYQCLEGSCCTSDFKFKPKDTPCYTMTHDVCDLFESCSGDHGFCTFDTWALDGTPCGSDNTKTCEFGVCVDNYGTKRPFARKCSQKCNNHGICNNRWNCHCEVGYICLNCVPFPGSEGGSIDSGAKCLSQPDEDTLLLNDLIAAVIIILFLNVLPIVSAVGFLLYSYVTSQGLAPSQYGLYSVADF